MEDLTRRGPSTVDKPTGASALVLGGQLTEGVSDLSEEMTAPGGVPALHEINPNRAHPDAPFVDEQNLPGTGDYRRLVNGSKEGTVPAVWENVSTGTRGVVKTFPPRPHASETEPGEAITPPPSTVPDPGAMH
jgi:hypothetical protein